MSKKKHDEHQEDVIVDIGGTYNSVEQWIENNKNMLIYVFGGLIAVIGGYYGYNSFYLEPAEVAAKEQIWKAQQYFNQDSLDLALYGDGNALGFEDIADEFGATNAGMMAKYYCGLIYINKGEYDLGIEYLQSFSSDDVMLSAVALGAIGDAYMELDDPDAAKDHYVKAANTNANEFTTPIYLMKAGKVAEALGDYNDAVKYYGQIKKDYPETTEGREVAKYIARAEKLAGE